MKVWIVNLSGHNYRNAQKWGELRPITTGYVSQGSLDRMLYDVTSSVAKSEPEDWLLPSGMLPLNILAGLAWLRKHKQVKLLLWDRKKDNGSGGYREMTVTMDHIDFLLEQLSSVEEIRSKAGESPS